MSGNISTQENGWTKMNKLLQLAEKFLTPGKLVLAKFVLLVVLSLALFSVYVNLIIRGL